MKKLLTRSLLGSLSLAVAAATIQAQDPLGRDDAIVPEIQVPVPLKPPENAEKSTNTTAGNSPTINFNNVAMVEYIRFLSKLSNKNFVFDETDLQFNVTIISEKPTTVDDLMAALLQELQIRNLMLIEQGNTLLIHQNPKVKSPGKIIIANAGSTASQENGIQTRVFRLNTLDPHKASDVIRPLLSGDSLVEVLQSSNTIIITDLTTNINKVAQLLNALDAPNNGVEIGRFVVKNNAVEVLVTLAEQILQPIAQGNPFVLIPHAASNSVFIVSNSFIVERGVAIFQYLDANDPKTQVLTLEQLRLQAEAIANAAASAAAAGTANAAAEEAERARKEAERLQGIPGVTPGSISPQTSGAIYRGEEGFHPGEISPASRAVRELPAGHIQRTLFYIYKLRYRKGDQIQTSLRKIADSLQTFGGTNGDLVGVINSAQWIESTNSLIFTGPAPALERIQELLEEVDVPLRQVFIEVLILDTTLSDSLGYGVDWGARFGGGNTAGAEAFIAPTSIFPTALDTAGVNLFPDASRLARVEGFHLGIIGRHLTHNGTQFASIGALVEAIHSDTRTNIVMNPKIITEDNNTAELFVGETTRYKTQSIANDQGTVLTNNFQFLDVGTTLKVTPLIGNNNIITLEIVQETTNQSPNSNPVIGANPNTVDVNLVPVTSKNKTTTKVHVPDKCFVILSGMLKDTRVRDVRQIPCLGGIPILGGGAKQKRIQDDKRNLMIFLRPQILDTEDDLVDLTRREQNIYIDKNKFKRSWNYEIEEALDFFNLQKNGVDEVWECADAE